MEKEEVLINSQFALFFDQPIMKPENLWQDLNGAMGDVFDQTPMIVPVPNDPKLNEVPILQMRSSPGIFNCNISRGRADFFYTGSGEQKFSDVKDDYKNKIFDLFIFFNKRIKISRIGFVTRFFVEDNEQEKTVAKLLDNNFTKLHDGNTYEVVIRYVSRDCIDELKINNLTLVEKFFARIAKDSNHVNKKGILITRDFNTIPEEKENYKEKFIAEKIKLFIDEGEKKFKLNEIKNILWPIMNQ